MSSPPLYATVPGAQGAGVAEGQQTACYSDTADRVRLIERYQAGIDGERARHRQRTPIFQQRGLSR
jgi:hypothetical protein